MAPQQNKAAQLQNGMRPNFKYSMQSSNSMGTSISNSRRQFNRPMEKIQESNNDKSVENTDKVFQIPVFAKPFKVPHQHDPISKPRSNSNHIEPSSLPTEGGRDVESILKMMTSTLEPLTKIAATPRTEIEVQQPNKPYVYANLPPFFKPPISNSSECNFNVMRLIQEV